MGKVLFAWVGTADLNAAKAEGASGFGPIAQALSERQFDYVVLLANQKKEAAEPYVQWLKKRTKADLILRLEKLSSPTAYAEIYEAVRNAVSAAVEKYGRKTKLTFHLSPGTPAMASIWIIAAKTQFEAELIESSKEIGVRTVDVPFQLSAEFIPAAVENASKDLALIAEGTRPEEPKFGDILYRSEVMKRLVYRAQQTVPFIESVLIEGESGTGKQLLAEAIHNTGPRKAKPFVEVNCGAVPRDLFESHFFGHLKGAFTGSDSTHIGYFQQANGGTLFLDEVGELPLEHQVKLLRVLQQKKVRPLKATADVSVDVRVIAATNRNLVEDVRAGRFREDLFYRLAVLVLKVPPLREREGDRTYLLQRLMERLNGERDPANQKELSVGARKVLLGHSWPGNVRELETSLRRAFVFSKGPRIDEAEARETLLTVPGLTDQGVLNRPLGDGFEIEGVVAEVARHYLARAMKDTNKNLRKATELVGLGSYQTLKNWLTKYEVGE